MKNKKQISLLKTLLHALGYVVAIDRCCGGSSRVDTRGLGNRTLVASSYVRHSNDRIKPVIPSVLALSVYCHNGIRLTRRTARKVIPSEQRSVHAMTIATALGTGAGHILTDRGDTVAILACDRVLWKFCGHKCRGCKYRNGIS